MSSILLPLALYVIIKLKIIVDSMIWNSNFTNTLLITVWIITVLYAWFVMLLQKHFKRALAYSTSENMGIILATFWLANPLAIKLAILHIIAHSFFKWASFMSVGNILVEQKTGQFDKIWNLTKNMKITSILTIISLIFLLWFPISPLFLSEVWVVWLLFQKNIFLSFILILALVLVFVWVLLNFSKMFKEKETDKTKFVNEKLWYKTIYTPIILSILFGLLSVLILFI
jgi:hydrogenase-4 component B